MCPNETWDTFLVLDFSVTFLVFFLIAISSKSKPVVQFNSYQLSTNDFKSICPFQINKYRRSSLLFLFIIGYYYFHLFQFDSIRYTRKTKSYQSESNSFIYTCIWILYVDHRFDIIEYKAKYNKAKKIIGNVHTLFTSYLMVISVHDRKSKRKKNS